MCNCPKQMEQDNYVGNMRTHNPICTKLCTHNLEGHGHKWSKFQISVFKNGPKVKCQRSEPIVTLKGIRTMIPKSETHIIISNMYKIINCRGKLR